MRNQRVDAARRSFLRGSLSVAAVGATVGLIPLAEAVGADEATTKASEGK